MINNFDRSYWIGASDCRYVFMNKNTATWDKWFAIKCGMRDSMFHGNDSTELGNLFEHPILHSYNPSIHTDRQLIVPKFNLRVNYDGDCDGTIYEVKTHRADVDISQYLSPPTSKKPNGGHYWQQAQVQMFCWKMFLKDAERYCDWHIREHIPQLKGHKILTYALGVDEYCKLEAYKSGDAEIVIDRARIEEHEIKYNKGFISRYKAQLKPIVKLIRNGDGIPW